MGQNNFKKDIQKLLDIVESDPVEDVIEKDTDVEKFIKTFNITSGTDFIPVFIIYYTYCRWRDRNRMTKRAFFNRFCKLFDSKIKSGVKGYFLDNKDELFDTSLENRFAARAFFRKSKVVRDRQKKKSKK